MIFLYLYCLCSVFKKGVFIYYNFICLFLAVLCLHYCVGFSLVVASMGYSLVAVHGLLIEVASLVAEHGL